jgi:hypothetical protein
MATSALNKLTSMPKLPISSGLMETTKKTPKGYLGGAEVGPALEELRGAESAAEQKIGQADVAIEEAKREEKGKEAEQKMLLAQRLGTEARELPERKALGEARKEMTEMAFVPTKETAQDLAALFSLVSVIGMVVGKSDSQRAMSAMNGMLEGHQKGRADLYKKEQIEFDKNFKAMQAKIGTLEKELDEAVKLKAYDKEAGEQAIYLALAKSESPLLKAMKDKQGDIAVLNAVKGSRKDLETVVNIQNKLQSEADARQARKEAQDAQNQLRKELAELKAQGSSKATQQQFIAQRAVNALGGVASAAESIMALPASTTVGVLPNLQTKDGMINFMRNSAARSLSSSEAKAMETLFTGITRNLAAIEASGTATGLTGLATQLEKLQPRAGDKAVDVALKMADIRRIATENINPLIDSGLIPAQQASTAKGLVGRIEKAIPFTTEEVVNAAYGGKGKTMTESGQAIVEKAKPQATFDADKEARYQKWLKENPQ